MYKTIYVPVDNSDWSNRAVDSALALGRAFDARLVGCHVYAARMHDYRFKQMEYTLPEEYLEETELERQRRIHDSLITMGLELISDSYLDPMRRRCAEERIEFEPRMMDGKHHVEILRDIAEQGYDLTVIGALGIGRSRDSQIGSVCERVCRHAGRDVLVIKRVPAEGEPDRDTILVGVDGSPQSFGALGAACELAKTLGKRVEAIAVYDPYLHYSVFNGVVNVLTERAAKVFRFEEQNQLHEEIIDTGLAKIYQSHLDVAEKMARDHGVEITKTLLDGKAYQKVLDHVRKTEPWLLVIGRIGVHSAKDEPGLGSNAENLLRLAPCDVLLTARVEHPELDLRAEETIRWTPEAERRFERVPPLVRGIARTAVYRLAVEQGHSVVSSAVLDEAMDRYMPKHTSRATEKLAEAVAFERARAGRVAICRTCGVTAAAAEPVKCTVCGGTAFQVVTEEMLEQIAAMEGGTSEEATYDGRKLKWTQDAKRALWTMQDAYRRRRVKARVEKSARGKRLGTVTVEFARTYIEEETGEPLVLAGAEAPPSEVEAALADGETKLVARDERRNPLVSRWAWTDEAVERILRVPAGFMRQRTQTRVEEIAAERAVETIDLALVEDGIEAGRRMMEQMIRGYQEARESGAPAAEAADAAGAEKPTAERPQANRIRNRSGNGNGNGNAGVYLNEVGLMSALEARRRNDAPSD